MYATADDGSNVRELWATDGTPTGTTLIKDINLGPSSSNPFYLSSLGGRIYFQADDGVSGVELWSITPPATSDVIKPDTPTTPTDEKVPPKKGPNKKGHLATPKSLPNTGA